MSDEPYTITKFMDLLIATFVLKGVRQVEVIGESQGAKRDRQGLYAMHQYAKEVATAAPLATDRWLFFLIRARNMLGPGNQGSFEEFRSELIQKTSTLVSLDNPHEGSYHFCVSEPHARSILAEADQIFAFYAWGAAEEFIRGRGATAS